MTLLDRAVMLYVSVKSFMIEARKIIYVWEAKIEFTCQFNIAALNEIL